MKSDPNRNLAHKVLLARVAIAFELFWLAVWPLMMVAGVMLLVVLTGTLTALPVSAKWIALAGLGGAGLFALKPLFSLRWPGEPAALRRIELASGLKHRPVSALHDRLAGTSPDSMSRSIWRGHQARLVAQLKGLKVGIPRSALPARDPFALRNALGIALVAALFLNAGNLESRVANTLGNPRDEISVASLDAWIAPPTYTAKPPLLLTGDAAARRLAAGEAFLVPESSALIVRLNGADAPKITLYAPKSDGSAGEPLTALDITASESGKTHETRLVLDRPVRAILTDGSRTIADWPFEMIPDTPPKAAVTDNISITPTGAFAVPWSASDDYGVASLEAKFRLLDSETGDAKTSARALHYDAPGFPVSMQKLNPVTATGRAFQDLTAHPWAGLSVELSLIATDQAGQTGTSPPIRFKLPERQFRKLLARVLIEQRRDLVRHPDNRSTVVRVLASLMAWPEKLLNKSGIYLSLRHVAREISVATSDEALKKSVDQLWELAVLIEDGDLTGALRELEALRKELQQALAEGAPPGRIAELMDKLRGALDKYLEAMAREMQKALRNGEQVNQDQLRQDNEIRSQDLQKMLDSIENLARSGARDAAQEMLAQLENILKNLQPGVSRTNPQSSSPMTKMLQELTEMMRKQQQLMDETFKLPGQRDGRPGQQRPGDQGQRSQGQGESRLQGLSDRQDSLGKMLQDLLNQLNQQGLNAPGSLNQSQQSMEGAAGSLRNNESGRALTQQGEAIEGLREGARSMAEQLMQQGTGNQGNYGRRGEARGEDRDPLGRPTARSGEDAGPDRNMIPGESAIQRARQILQYLRERANNPKRPQIELDYFDRLLRGLY